MGKSKRAEKEFSKEKRLVHENRQLKRQVSSLRKELARIDLDRYGQVKDAIEEHSEDDNNGADILESLKKAWKCNVCDDGYLEIFTYNKANCTWYYRICSNAPRCKNRTVSQKWSQSVKGIVRKT